MDTDRIERDRVEVVIFTTHYRIEGEIHLPPGGRITDFVNIANTDFIAVTRARIYHSTQTREEGPLIEEEFLALNKNCIIIISPKEKGEERFG